MRRNDINVNIWFWSLWKKLACKGLIITVYCNEASDMEPAPCFIIKTIFWCIWIPIIKTRWSWDCLIFIVEICILVRQFLNSEMFPRLLVSWGKFCSQPPQKVITLHSFLWDVITHPCLNFNTLRQRQNGRHFADDFFKCIFLNENFWILHKISMKYIP